MKDLKVQCGSCPWKVTTVPERDIPNGYSRERHEALSRTIAEPGAIRPGHQFARMMACHHSNAGSERVCVGWAINQMGVGNNLGLRIQALRDERLQGLQTEGEQHERFEDTLS